MDNVNDQFFNGIYQEIWRAMIPDILTQREVDFISSYFNLNTTSRVLDLMCGYGRHAVALAGLNVPVVAVDNLESYIGEIKKKAISGNLPLEAVCADVKTYHPDRLFDLAICMGNSINFYPQEDVLHILKNIRPSLKENAHLLINSWSLAEITEHSFKEESTGYVAGIRCETWSQRLHEPERIESRTVFTKPGGQREEKVAVDYILSLGEFEVLFEQAGFRLGEVFSIPGKKIFQPGDPRAYVIASVA